jgi:hypothetical protein
VSVLPVHLRAYAGAAAAPAEALARGQRGNYVDAVIGGDDAGGSDRPALLPRYGFARFASRPETFFLAVEQEERDEPPPRPEGRSTYAVAAERGRVEIPSGDLVDLRV